MSPYRVRCRADGLMCRAWCSVAAQLSLDLGHADALVSAAWLHDVGYWGWHPQPADSSAASLYEDSLARTTPRYPGSASSLGGLRRRPLGWEHVQHLLGQGVPLAGPWRPAGGDFPPAGSPHSQGMANSNKRMGDRAERDALAVLCRLAPDLVVARPQRLLVPGAARTPVTGCGVTVRWNTRRPAHAIRLARTGPRCRRGAPGNFARVAPIPRACARAVCWVACCTAWPRSIPCNARRVRQCHRCAAACAA